MAINWNQSFESKISLFIFMLTLKLFKHRKYNYWMISLHREMILNEMWWPGGCKEIFPIILYSPIILYHDSISLTNLKISSKSLIWKVFSKPPLASLHTITNVSFTDHREWHLFQQMNHLLFQLPFRPLLRSFHLPTNYFRLPVLVTVAIPSPLPPSSYQAIVPCMLQCPQDNTPPYWQCSKIMQAMTGSNNATFLCFCVIWRVCQGWIRLIFDKAVANSSWINYGNLDVNNMVNSRFGIWTMQ